MIFLKIFQKVPLTMLFGTVFSSKMTKFSHKKIHCLILFQALQIQNIWSTFYTKFLTAGISKYLN